MAGGKLSPRMKMISLMYLVFIAMLALNMSKEVLNAFGLLNVSLEESNVTATAKNANAMQGLNQLASDQPEKFKDLKVKGEKVNQISNEYFSYLGDLKDEMEGTVEDPTDYQVMDKGDYLDNRFFQGDKLSSDGEEFVSKMNAYRTGMLDVVGADSQAGMRLKKEFTPDEEENRDGINMGYLDYHYKGYPLIASIAKVTFYKVKLKM